MATVVTRKRGWKKRSLAEIMARNVRGEKRCRNCHYWLPEDEFLSGHSRTSDGLSGRCKACDRFGRYELTRRDVDHLLREQGHCCPICYRDFASYSDFAVDHSHACCPIYGGRKRCGKCTRGLICVNCNVKVLAVLEDAELMTSARNYLEKYS